MQLNKHFFLYNGILQAQRVIGEISFLPFEQARITIVTNIKYQISNNK